MAGSLRPVLLCAFLMLLMGCKETLYHNLSERDANEIYAVLAMSGIDAERQYSATNETYTVLVSESQLAEAVLTLQQKGLPRQEFKSVAQVFSDESFVSSPFVEKVRYVYALSQELSESISLIAGVYSARVHIVIPEEAKLGREARPAKATVYIYYLPDFQPDLVIPAIKASLSNSVDNLTYENISIVEFPVNLGISQ